MDKKIFCVISHTHWDREWYSPLEIFRHRLTDLFDRLFVILENNPQFVFHMDAQTIVLEDYLAVRPDKKDLLKKFISERRIMVGPWYLQNDFYLTSGESTVRNLLEGAKLCTEFGGKGGIGYAADQFGNISQLPQILDNFGYQNFVFGRGFNEFDFDAEVGPDGFPRRQKSPTEFIWEGADGTKVLALHMRYWYNNAQRFSSDIDKATKMLEAIEETFKDAFTFTPYYLLMNGVDHLEPQSDLLEVLNKLQETLPENKAIMQYNFDDYVADVRKYVDDNDVELPVVSGELRRGHDWDLLKGTLSSRHYLKVANCRAQALLENRMEPLYAMMERNGMKGVYPFDQLRYTWKNLMRNHPHDSICGCSRDEVHAHMENRYAEIFEYGNELLRRGMQTASDHMATMSKGGEQDYILTVANTLSVPTSECVKATFKFIESDGFDNFEMLDENGNAVDFIITNKYRNRHDVFSPLNLPGTLDVDVYDVIVNVGEVTPYSFKSFLVRRKDGKAEVAPKICCDNLSIKSDKFVVDFVDGKVNITDKSTDRKICDCISIEETADIGDSYVFVTDGGTPTIFDTYKSAEIISKNAYEQIVRVVYDVPSPAEYDFDNKCRSAETVVSTVTLDLILTKGRDWVEVKYSVDNKAKDHRIRVVVNTDVVSKHALADIAYDIVSHTDEDHYPLTYSKVFPNATFAALCDDNNDNGFAVFTQGAHEFEVLDDKNLAFTIIRGTGGINVGASDNWKVPGNQEIRVIEGELGLHPFVGDLISADVINTTLKFRAPLLNITACCDTRRFTGGRPCVQDTELSEFFYLPDLYPEVAIKNNVPAIKVEGKGIQVTAFKRSENGNGLILRVVNLSDEDAVAKITAKGKIFKTTMAEIKRSFVDFDNAEFTLTPKKILTLLID